MSEPLAIILTYIAVVVIFLAAIYYGGLAICRIFDGLEETPEERSYREAERIAKQATKEYKRRKRLG